MLISPHPVRSLLPSRWLRRPIQAAAVSAFVLIPLPPVRFSRCSTGDDLTESRGLGCSSHGVSDAAAPAVALVPLHPFRTSMGSRGRIVQQPSQRFIEQEQRMALAGYDFLYEADDQL